MFEPWSVITTQATLGTEEDIREVYGEDAVITRVKGYNLIHLDSPSAQELERRKAEFDPENLFEDDCPICRMMKEQGVDVVFVGENPEEECLN